MKEYKAKQYRKMILPCLGIPATLLMLFVLCYAHGYAPLREGMEEGYFACPMLTYGAVFSAVMALGALFYRKKK